MKKAKIAILTALAFGLVFLLYALDFSSWQKLDTDKILRPNAVSLWYDRLDTEVGAIGGGQSAKLIGPEEIPLCVKNAFIACEDKRFYEHKGIDIRRIIAAAFKNLKSSSFSEGGSTITQQLIKLTHLSQEKKISRKANEAWLALKLERELSKDEILTAYLNTVYFGSGAYGIENASNVYFGKSARELTLLEGAMLAGIIKAPSAYSPHKDMEKALTRRNYVLSRMREDGYITEDELKDALNEDIRIIKRTKEDRYGWYRDLVIKEAADVLGLEENEILTGGYRIYTGFDPARQERCDQLFENDSLFPSDSDDGESAQSAFIAMDCETGGILAVAGGRRYEVERGYNRATQAKRQPGSALKPLSVYAAAVDALGMVPTSIVDDTKRTFDGGYAPKNAKDSYYGLVTLREALSRSLNVASVSLMEFTGIERAREYIGRFGIPLDEKDDGLALALGSMTWGVSPCQIAEGYSALSNGGMRVKAHAVRRIIDRNGRTAYEFMPPDIRAVTSESAYILTSMLVTAAKSGSARALNKVECPVAAKTGTVSIDENRNRDAWTAAYTSEIAACVWMGFDRTTDDRCLKGDEGGSFAAKLMAEFMMDETGGEFKKSPSIVELSIDKNALESEKRVWLAPAYAPASLTLNEIFRLGQEPNGFSPAFQAPPAPDAPMVYEKSDEVIIRFEAQEDYYEYLVFETCAGHKKMLCAVTGKKGEIMETSTERKQEDALYSLAARNKTLHEAGVSLIGMESNAVEVKGRYTFSDIFEKMILNPDF